MKITNRQDEDNSTVDKTIVIKKKSLSTSSLGLIKSPRKRNPPTRNKSLEKQTPKTKIISSSYKSFMTENIPKLLKKYSVV